MTRPSQSDRFVQSAPLGWEPAGVGVERQILGYDDQLMLVRVRFEPGAVGTVHHHPHRQVTYVEAGTFEVEVGGETRTLRAGDSFFAPPDVAHGVVARDAGVAGDVFAPAREDFLG